MVRGISDVMTTEPSEPRAPDLVADVRLYSSEEGGRKEPARHGYFPPCFPTRDANAEGWDARMQLGDQVFEPGTSRRVGFVFLSKESAEAARRAGHFYLWDGGFVGEATVLK
jgi:hypothetical protein